MTRTHSCNSSHSRAGRTRRPFSAAAPRKAARGFTLIELMVTMTGSLLFTVFVFMLSRDVSRFFQSSTRSADATIAVLSGFERLRTDIARAGFLASPNLARDANRCPRPIPGTAVTPPQQSGSEFTAFPGLQKMALLNLRTNPDISANYMITENSKTGLAPDNLTMWGNYTTSEQFPVRSLSTGSPRVVYLEADSPALARIGVTSATSDADAVATLTQIFPVGKLLRIVDETGREQYALSNGVTVNTGLASISLDGAITLIDKNASSKLCGIRGNAQGLSINPVDIIRYAVTDVRADLSNYDHLKYLYSGSAPSYDNTRLDLVRYTLGPEVAPTANAADIATKYKEPTSELVAEYAVDLRFGLTVVSNTQTGALTYLPEGHADLGKYAGDPTASPAADLIAGTATLGPHFIRGVHARLVVRQREADRDIAILADPGNATAEALYRVKLDDENNYARIRTLRSHIATRNTQNLMWN